MRSKTITIHEFMEIERAKGSKEVGFNSKPFYIVAAIIIASSLLITANFNTDTTITAFQQLNNIGIF